MAPRNFAVIKVRDEAYNDTKVNHRRRKMARGPKKKLDDQIRSVDEQIAKVSRKLDELLALKESLVQQKREEEVGRLYNLMVENGKTLDEIEQIIIASADTQEIA